MMQWKDLPDRFAGPGGPVAVNGDAERWCLNKLDLGAVRLAVEDALAPPGGSPTKRWLALCRDLPLSGKSSDFKAWLQTLVSTPTGACKDAAARPLRLLGALRFRGVVLWPSAGHLQPHPCEAGKTWRPRFGRTAYEQALLKSMPVGVAGVAHFIMSFSPIRSADEVYEAALLRALEVATASRFWTKYKSRGGGPVLLRRLEGERRSDGSTVAVMKHAQKMLHRNNLSGRAVPRYGAAEARADARPWIGAFARASAASRRKTGYSQDRAWALWLEFLADSGSIPPPPAITRPLHILGPNGYLAWLRSRSDPFGHGYSSKLAQLRELMAFMAAQGEMPTVPIRPGDIPPRPPNNGKSDKLILPRELMERAREVTREIQARSDGCRM